MKLRAPVAKQVQVEDRAPAASALEESRSPLRKRSLEVVRQNPGATIRKVARVLGCAHPTAAYHLSALCKAGYLVKEWEGRRVRHYLASEGATPAAHLAAQVRDLRKWRIASFLSDEPVDELSLNQVAKRVGVTFGFLKRTLEQYETHGLVRLERINHVYRVRPLPPLVEAVQRIHSAGGALDAARAEGPMDVASK